MPYSSAGKHLDSQDNIAIDRLDGDLVSKASKSLINDAKSEMMQDPRQDYDDQENYVSPGSLVPVSDYGDGRTEENVYIFAGKVN